jgi:O-antigen/teichoic acid export membrane protein
MNLHLGDGIRSMLDNGVRFMGIGWLETALAAVYFAVIARYLGPALYGQWAYGIAAYCLVLGVAGFGLDTLVLLRLGRNRPNAGDFLGLTLVLRLASLAVGAAGLAAYALAAAPDALTMLVLLLFLPALVGRGVAGWARIAFLGYGRVADYARIAVVLRSAEAACGIAYLVAGGGLVGIVVLHSLLWVGEAVLGVWRTRSHLTRFTLSFAWQPARDLIAQGAVLGISAAGYTWLVSGPIMLLQHAGVGMAALGQFAVVSSLTMILVGSAHAFFAAALPVLSRSTPRAASQMPGYGRLTALAVAVAAFAAAALGWLLGPPLAASVLGARYAIAGGLVGPFLLIGGVALAPTGYNQNLLLAGRRWPTALADLAGALCLAGAFQPAVAAWGLDGALAATAAGWLVRGAMLIGMGEFDACRLRRRHLAIAPVAPGTDQLA